MKRAAIVLLLGVLFALLVFPFNERDDGQTIIAEWERLGQAYADGEISYWEYVRRADALTARRETSAETASAKRARGPVHMNKIHCEPHQTGLSFEYEVSCIKRLKKRPWPLCYRRFSFRRRDRGGQAPALR